MARCTTSLGMRPPYDASITVSDLRGIEPLRDGATPSSTMLLVACVCDAHTRPTKQVLYTAMIMCSVNLTSPPPALPTCRRYF